MKNYLLATSLTIFVVNTTFTKQTLAATMAAPPEVTLYAAGSLRGALSEVASAFTQEFGISVKTEFASSGSLKDRSVRLGLLELPPFFKRENNSLTQNIN